MVLMAQRSGKTEGGTDRRIFRFHRLVSKLPPTFSSTMAWRCSGSTNVELIENMAKNGLINSPRVRNVRKTCRPADLSISMSEHALSPRRR